MLLIRNTEPNVVRTCPQEQHICTAMAVQQKRDDMQEQHRVNILVHTQHVCVT